MSGRRVTKATVGAVVAAVFSGAVTWATPGSGTVSLLVGRATFEDAFAVKREDPATGWEMEAEAKPNLDIAVTVTDFAIGGHSGWHSHPGPAFISVVAGTMTFYDSDDPACEPIVRTAGQGFLDVGGHAHIARNESGTAARVVVTFFAPPGAPLRIDQLNPGNCQFRGF